MRGPRRKLKAAAPQAPNVVGPERRGRPPRAERAGRRAPPCWGVRRGRSCAEAIDVTSKLTPTSFSLMSRLILSAFQFRFTVTLVVGRGEGRSAKPGWVAGCGGERPSSGRCSLPPGTPVAQPKSHPGAGGGPSEGGTKTYLPRGDVYFLWAMEVISLLVS